MRNGICKGSKLEAGRDEKLKIYEVWPNISLTPTTRADLQ